jgi:hypothetical protein
VAAAKKADRLMPGQVECRLIRRSRVKKMRDESFKRLDDSIFVLLQRGV